MPAGDAILECGGQTLEGGGIEPNFLRLGGRQRIDHLRALPVAKAQYRRYRRQIKLMTERLPVPGRKQSLR